MNGFTPQAIWSRIRRARLIRVLVVYAGASFAVLEAVDLVAQQVGLPEWVGPGALVLLLIGFPIIVATALAQSAPAAPTPVDDAGPSVASAAPDPAAMRPERKGSADELAAAAKNWLTWRKAILGGVLAFAAWGVIITGYMTMRVLGIGPVGSLVAAGVLDERERIVLADFENRTADSTLATVVTEAFRIDLSQSPVVNVVPPEFVTEALDRMEREPGLTIDRELARELALREGIKAFLAGEIGTAGESYVLSAQLVSAESGEILTAFRETADDGGEIVDAIDRLSKRFRERIGESLKSLRNTEPLDRVTTASLDALRKYSQGVRVFDRGEMERAIELFEEAVALDTAFAMAYRKLGVAIFNRGGEQERRTEAFSRAFEHRDRLPDRERYMTEGTYYQLVTDEPEKAIAAYRTLLESHPEDVGALNNLGILYSDARDFARAEELYRRLIRHDSTGWTGRTNLIGAQVAQGDMEGALATLEAAAARLPGHPEVMSYEAQLAFARGAYDSADAHLLRLREAHPTSLRWRTDTGIRLAAHARTRGRLAQAERYLRDAMAAFDERGLGAAYVANAATLAGIEGRERNAPERGIRVLETALEKYPLQEMPTLDRPYNWLAWNYAYLGQTERARALLDEYEREVEPELRRGDDFLHAASGTVALADGHYEDAIAAFRRFDDRIPCQVCALPQLGLAFEGAGMPDSALAYYERYVTLPWLWRHPVDSWSLGPSYERLAALYEERGEAGKAIQYYGKLIELWEDADPELQPRVESARRAIRALSPDR